MRPSHAASGLACMLLLSLLLVTPTAVADPVGCTVALAEAQYYDTGAYVFGHGQVKDYAVDTGGNVGAFATCPLLSPACESALVGAQVQSTKDYQAHGQLKDYAADTGGNAGAYVVCKAVL